MTTTNNDDNKKNSEYNPRWKGYVFIALTSLINFCSISTVKQRTKQQDDDTLELWAGSLVFGLFTFTLSLLVLLQDRSQMCLSIFHYINARNGTVEGYTLVLMTLWWIVGVGYQTCVGGIAYVANNIYYSSWASLLR
jgi:hypothetical protein